MTYLGSSDPADALHWCIGGRCGRPDPAMVKDHQVFLARLLESLFTNPLLLGGAGPGIDAIADPEDLAGNCSGPPRPLAYESRVPTEDR